jgi:hypothetical protein
MPRDDEREAECEERIRALMERAQKQLRTKLSPDSAKPARATRTPNPPRSTKKSK